MNTFVDYQVPEHVKTIVYFDPKVKIIIKGINFFSG